MHSVVPKFVKYLLRIIFTIIVLILMIGLEKSNRNLSRYTSLLNHTNISDLKGGKIFDTIRPKSEKETPDNKITSSTGKVLIPEENNTGLDVYDPNFEEDMQNASLDAMLSGSEEDFGFKSTGSDKSTSNIQTQTKVTTTGTTKISDPQKNLLELIKQQEMKK